MNLSLRVRLGLGLGLAVGLSLGVLGFAVEQSTRSDLLGIARRQLEGSLSRRVQTAPHPPAAPSAAGDPRRVATAHLSFDADGTQTVAEAAGPPTDPLPLPIVTAADVQRLRGGSAVTVQSTDADLRYLALGAERSDGRLEVEAAPLDAVDSTMDGLVRRLLVGSLITLCAVVAVATLALRRGLKPLDDVVATADAVAAGEREQRITADRGPTEIRHLALSLDRMLQQQRGALSAREQSEARLRRFIADASHELQTPLTSVLGWAELQRKGALDEAGRVTATARIEAESRRMTRLIDEMLVLARLDEHRTSERAQVELVALARDAVTDANAADTGHLIVLDAGSPVIVTGDAAHLRQVLDNLLRNVATHTPDGTRGIVSVVAEAGAAVITVSDDGPGFAPEQAQHVFDRFWRGDTSRARATGGSGLGLSIVAALVDAHGGTVSATNRDGGGAVFSVTLPRT